MENTLVKVHGLLPAFLNVSGPIEDISMGLRGDSDRDQRLFVHARVVDCSHFASSDSPCGQTQAVPQLKLSLREGESKREFIFKGVGDAQGVLHWLRTVLPPRYGRRDVPSIPLTRKRSLLRPMMFSLPFWSGKDVLDRIRAAPPDQATVMFTAGPHGRSAAEMLGLGEELFHLLNDTSAGAIQWNKSLTMSHLTLSDDFSKKRWLPSSLRTPQVLYFPPAELNHRKEPSLLPSVYHGPRMPCALLEFLAFLIPTFDNYVMRCRSEARQSGHGRYLSDLLGGIASSTVLSGRVNVVREDDVKALKRSYRQTAALGVSGAGDPMSKHLFVSLLVAPWVAKAQVQREISRFLSVADRFDPDNNPVTASFSIIDITAINTSVGSVFYQRYLGSVGGVTLRDICIFPPCILTCRHAKSPKAPKCGEGVPFHRYTHFIDHVSFERFLNLAVEPADEEIYAAMRPLSMLHDAMQLDKAVTPVDSLRPWIALDGLRVHSKAGSEGDVTERSGWLKHRRHILCCRRPRSALPVPRTWGKTNGTVGTTRRSSR